MEPAQREAEWQAKTLNAYDALVPGVVGNKYIPHWPTERQARFLGLHQSHDPGEVFRALYGGAAGGGKSDALLMAAAQYVDSPEFSGICFRRSHTELALPGALMDRAYGWWHPLGVHWDGTNKVFRFPSGATVTMAYLAAPKDHHRYQGAEFHFTAWDELTHWETSAQYKFVGLSRVRRREGCTIPLRTLAASNPGGPGHNWVQAEFIGETDLLTGEEKPGAHPYVPATIGDNPHLDREAYERTLIHLHPTLRAQLLEGDWRAREPGDYFRAEWFGPLLDPAEDLWPARDCVRIRYWDLAASESDDAARTAGVLMSRHRGGCRAVEHAVAFRRTTGTRDSLIVQQAKADGPGVIQGLEIEPGSGGISQVLYLEKLLKAAGCRVVYHRPKVELTDAEGELMIRNPSTEKGKAGRAGPVASCLERGYQRRGESRDKGGLWWGLDEGKSLAEQRDGLRCFAGPWTRDYLDELSGFGEEKVVLCDLVDATSAAWTWLEAHPFGLGTPMRNRVEREKAQQQDVHPADRPKASSGAKDKAGRWRP